MAILNPDHLIEQAAELIRPPPAGPPRQVDLRRAISSAYYAVFHATLAAVADAFVGRTNRASEQYALVYRSVSHERFKRTCGQVQGPLPPELRNLAPSGFSTDLRRFALAGLTLQEARHTADYDPRPRFRTSNALAQIDLAKVALRHWLNASTEQRTVFLMLLAFEPRRQREARRR